MNIPSTPSIRLALVMIGLFLSLPSFAQYSNDALTVKRLSELYDERGFEQGKAISVDGKLMVSGANGNVSYSYPISKTTVNGYPFEVNLNYCGSVAFTAFKDFYEGGYTDPYRRWGKFQQNRPLWILGVNGFAVQCLSATSGSFHGDSALASANSGTLFDDSRMIWTIDGYDFCNSMTPLEQESESHLVDEIHILRSDGSLLQLVNESYSGQDEPSAHPEVYTGYYFANEANAHGFGIVEYDFDGWPGFVHTEIDDITGGVNEFPYIPRKLHYFPGDGLEYVFREWVIPYGIKPYLGRGEGSPNRWGGVNAGPTIFYLEEIRSNLGLVSAFTRSRQFYPNVHTTLVNGNIYDPKFDFIEDSTRGRALITDFYGHTISYGDVGLTIEAFGRTTKVLFTTQSRSGDAGTDEYMPLGTLGYMTYAAAGQAAAEERSAGLYKSFVGYVDKIIDPEGRETSFEYEPYTRTYIGYNFPYSNSSAAVRLKNYRMKKVTEPTASYAISYKRGANLWPDEDTKLTDTLYQNVADPGHDYPFLLSNVASYVRKYDRDGTLLTTQYGVYSHDGNTFYAGTQTTTDNISGHTREVRTAYKIYPLPDYFSGLVHPNYTGLISTTEIAGDLATVTSVNYDSMALGPNMVLPVKQTVSVNGVLKSDQRFTYVLDTLRTYGGDDSLTEKFGWEVTRKATTTLDPSTGGPLLRDTTEYTYVPLIDTTLTRLDTFYMKFKMMENYRRLRDSGVITVPWEYAFYDPRVFAFDLDSVEARGMMPPAYGLEKRSWRSLADGTFLRGSEKFYHNPSPPFHYLNDLEFRGTLDSEVVTGEGRARTILATRYEYVDNWKKLPSRTTNANGAAQRLYYGFGSLNTPGHNFTAIGHIRYDNDVIHDTVLPNGDYFALSYEKPPAVDRYVRRFTDTNAGAIVTDTLRELSEYGYFGQIIGKVDLNGNYSRFRYDRNGRLLMAWLPYDFPRRENPDTAQYYGTETIDLYGYTRYSARVDTLICRPQGDTNTISHDSTSDTTTVEGLYAAHPIGEPGECSGGCGEGPFGRTKRSDIRRMLRFCIDTIRYPLDEYYTGVLRYVVDSASPLLAIDPLSHAYLELHTTSISSGCVTLTIEIPQFGYSHAITFNCETDTDPGGDDGGGGTGLGRTKRPRTTIQSGGADSSRLVRLDLTSIASSLHGLALNSVLAINLKVTTADGAIGFVDGSNGEDTRPKLMLEGTIHRISDEADYTLAYDHNDTTLTTRVRAKVDDSLHTANWYGRSTNAGASLRLTESAHYFGADYRVERSEVSIGDYRSPSRIDSVVNAFSGLGEKTRVMDPEGDTVVTRYDTAGRPVEIVNPDGTRSTIDYQISSSCFGDQNFYGFCMRKRSTDERGISFEQYYDAFDRLRREISGITADTSKPTRTVKYEYDLLGQLTQVTNPAGQVTTYTYDDFGHVKSKAMPDIGTVSYAYDRLGNLRFSQTQEQAKRSQLGFTEYDDLNRPTLIGEAVIDKSGCTTFCEDSLYETPYSCGGSTSGRLTDAIDPDLLHVGSGSSSILTANSTLFGPPDTVMFDHVNGATITDTLTNCALSASPLLGELSAPSNPKIMHPVQVYSHCFPSATAGDFENMRAHTEFARIAINYDRLPIPGHTVWAPFPPAAVWDAMAPAGQVRNLKGREAAIAYRERASEPFHYTVLSYDDRGRVEAILRCTENLGFDAVYYTYNAMNQVTSVTVSDPIRSYTTWYGYDYNGRIDSVWAKLGAPGSGLIASGNKSQNKIQYPSSLALRHPSQTADISYHYRKGGQVDTMRYPPVNMLVSYAYNHRKWLDTLIATQGGGFMFREALGYDSSGQILWQSYKHAGTGEQTQEYRYDNHDQLTAWTVGASLDSVMYTYDIVGNRTAMTDTRLDSSAMLAYGAQVNQLTQRDQPVTGGDTTHTYQYDGNGSLRRRKLVYTDSAHPSGRPLWDEHERYSYRGLFNWSHRTDSLNNIFDWRYRYSASGEREQKRLVYTTVWDSVMGYPWTYYALGAGNQQLAVYHGQQVSDVKCGKTGRRVYMYPTEYLSYGVGSVMSFTTDANGAKQYKVADHLGSTRLAVSGAGTDGQYNYAPYGKREVVSATLPTRKGFIDREQDLETGLGNFGKRQIGDDDGSFISIDPLWEEYRALSPYHYAANNPQRIVDPSGGSGDTLADGIGKAKELIKGIWADTKSGIEDEIKHPYKIIVNLCPPCLAVEQTYKLTQPGGLKNAAIDLAVNLIPVRIPQAMKVEVLRFVENVTIKSFGKVIAKDAVVDLEPTLRRIERGAVNSHKNDGSIFKNRAGDLPSQPYGYYREYVHPTPGINGPGPQRVVIGNGGDVYYTPDHYQSFVKISKP